MKTKIIEVVTLTHGVRADQKTDMEIFELIKELEKRAEDLKSIKRRPNKLNEHIKSIEDGITLLITYVDNRKAKND